MDKKYTTIVVCIRCGKANHLPDTELIYHPKPILKKKEVNKNGLVKKKQSTRRKSN